MATRDSFRQRLTKGLIQGLEEHDGLPWAQVRNNVVSRPFNPVSGVKYKGGNNVGLLLEQLRRGSSDPRWMTLKQANEAGYRIRAGAKAAYVEYWDWGVPWLKLNKADDKDASAEDDETEEQARARTKPRPFYAALFNGADVLGLPEIVRERTWQAHEVAEKLIRATGADIEHESSSQIGSYVVVNGAYYTREPDKILVPPRNAFKSQDDYYATVIGMLARWTGHASRLDRKAPVLPHIVGDAAHAREELRAHIATVFLTSMLGIQGKQDDGGRYAGVWREMLKGDQHEIFRAARDAELIVDHIFGYAPELREIVDGALAANMLPENRSKRRLPIGDELPNFIPAGVEPAAPVVRTGRADPRWAGFEKALLETAKKAGLNAEAIAPVFDMIEPNFTTIMDGMKTKGVDEDMVYQMIGAQIIDEMKQADVHHQKWEEFAGKVRTSANGIEVEVVESALQEINSRYQKVLVESVNARWDAQKTQQALHQVLYGQDNAGAVIDAAFVQRLVDASPAAKALTTASDEDDDDVLMPLGMSDVLPEDAGIVDDERMARPSPSI
ncbi:ArdC family protein [Bordetella flabilis]|uniref:DUF1738 domain-containing protein n=1 Tax=Bordetella flabilis TaxID=463014 RepID=A0A193GMY7_9BORD|nr:zincin-like metallopeptidase domain-containing protein [Bordetella flabilis]ANN80856.1 hypothetical protein BAU07_26405 [Bordetella flabilis]